MQKIDASPRLKARITGAFYLLTILTEIFAQHCQGQRERRSGGQCVPGRDYHGDLHRDRRREFHSLGHAARDGS